MSAERATDLRLVREIGPFWFDNTPLEPVRLAAYKARAYLPVSLELLDDNWLPVLRYWTAEEWAVEVARLRRVRQILDAQPLAAVKAAATRDVTRAERVRRFPHTTWETPHRWYDLDDEGRPKKEAD